MAYASIDDYEVRYGAVDDQERTGVLLEDASSLIDAARRRRRREPDETFNENACPVCCAIVHRALSTPMGMEGVTSGSVTAGVYSQSLTWANPTGDLWLGKSDLKRLGLYGSRAGSSMQTGAGEDA